MVKKDKKLYILINNKMQKRTKILITILFVILVISNIFFIYEYLLSSRNMEIMIQKQQINSKILSFTQLFMDKVLQGSTTVSFDDRLQLENSVRALNDNEIFSSWQKFTNAKSQTEIQQDFYKLFDLLLKSIEI